MNEALLYTRTPCYLSTVKGLLPRSRVEWALLIVAFTFKIVMEG